MMRAVLALCRVIVGALFIWAATTKIPDLHGFGEEIANYRIVPTALVPLLAVALPGIELLAGALLILGLWSRAAAGIISAMLVVFIVALSQALLRGINLQCGCFGGADEATWFTVIRDVARLVPAALVLWKGPGRWAAETSALESQL
jgi:uncharacterized membrane protein YphA (DoxX/SURF4 family)